jgi:hypothetical protein
MHLISHRGNLIGPNPETENTPDSIRKAIDLGFEVEVDVWLSDGKFYLGHDAPQHKTTFDFLSAWSDRLWIHCKNKEALVELLDFNVFWHDTDKYVLTKNGAIWCHANHPICSRRAINHYSVLSKSRPWESGGIYSDFILNCKELCLTN